MVTMRVISLDVWGNDDDGFQVNQSFRTSFTVELSEEPSDKEIQDALIGIEYLSETAETYTDGEMDFALTVYSSSNGRPLLELHPDTDSL